MYLHKHTVCLCLDIQDPVRRKHRELATRRLEVTQLDCEAKDANESFLLFPLLSNHSQLVRKMDLCFLASVVYTTVYSVVVEV